MGKRRTHLPVERVGAIPEFTPVPRRYRHDGWTPERQKAFIEALAVTGCVDRAAAHVNIAQTNCYELRKAPGAEGFRRAWDAALDFGTKKLKDIAFERAINGYLEPVFVAGKLMGFRRKYNDALLMFCLRHYGEDAGGKRTTINYFSTRATSTSSGQASAGAVPQEAPPPLPAGAVPLPEQARGGLAEASATTVRTVIRGAGANDNASRLDAAAGVLEGFEGVTLDAEAEAAIAAALEGYAERVREARAALDEGGEAGADASAALGNPFVRADIGSLPYDAPIELGVGMEEFVPFVPGEPHWTLAGEEKLPALIDFEERLARGEVEGVGGGSSCA